MSVTIDINVKGLDKLSNVFEKIKLAPRITRAIEVFALKVEGESKRFTPVDTGTLRSSIRTRFAQTFIGNTFGAIVSTNTNYARYVHQGTYKMKGRPFMKQGVESAQQALGIDFIGKEIDAELREVARRAST